MESRMKLCIAEKPSVAKEIAKVLKANRRQDGYFEGNGYYVSWTFGHLCELEEPAGYTSSWKSWNLNQLPMIPQKFEIQLKKDKGIQKQFKVICNLLKNTEEVINCGDAGQEGELIQRWVLKKANYEKEHKRLWISSLTDTAIRKGFQNLRSSKDFDSLYHAGLFRAIGDWLVGINGTRVYTLKFGGMGNLLSVGRVQTPTLALIVKRDQEIKNFKVEPYWKIITLYREAKFFHKQEQFKKKDEAEQVLSEIQGKLLQVTNLEKKTVKVPAPKLFDLTTLQVECNRRFGFSAERTLNLAQQLYEKKVLTYPRVDTQFLSDDIFKSIPKTLTNLSSQQAYTGFIQQIPKPIKKSKRYFNNAKVTDHHAIIPTDSGKTGNLSADEFQVFDLVARRFMAIFLPDAIEEKTKVTAIVEKHEFIARGNVLKDAGWKVLYPKAKKSTGTEEEQSLPIFKKGESGSHQPKIEDKETQPPKPYTEGTLLRAMETCGKMMQDDELREAMKANGIGRPSTRAAILKTLFFRGYLEKQKKNLFPTEKGTALINLMLPALRSPILTGEWEYKLRKVESGELKAGVFYHELKNFVTQVIQEVKASQARVIHSPPTKNSFQKTNSSTKQKTVPQKTSPSSTENKVNDIGICPKCKQGEIIEGKKAFGCSYWKSGCNFTIWKEICHKKITINQIKALVQQGKTKKMKGFKSKENKKFEATLVLQENYSVGLEF
ncbi:MAG: DNA topoisomerase-3 [bacterium]|jgi:DNA topoisomerase-3